MARSARPSGDPVPPKDMANVVPTDVANAGQTRLLVDAIKEAVAELKSDVKDVKDYRHSDFKWYICTFGAGFVALAGLSLYLYSRIEDRLSALSTAVTKVEIRLESLQRSASPEPSAAPKKQGGAP